MSATQITSEYGQSDIQQCKRCNVELPKDATFCSNCGERVENHGAPTSSTNNILERYRIMSLIRRNSSAKIFRAIDTQQRCPVIIHDIDISRLDTTTRTEVIAAQRKEYDDLSRQAIPDLIPLINLHTTDEHTYIVAGWPLSKGEKSQEQTPQTQHNKIYTLQDLLQSGAGLPEEHVALDWIYRLSQTVAHLHKRHIVIRDLDPHTIILSENSYQAELALMVCWLPAPMRKQLTSDTQRSAINLFCAPEALSGTVEMQSDIYSLGAVLYLLLTGVVPERNTSQEVRSPREITSRLSTDVETVVMQTLASKVTNRLQSVDELAQILLHLSSNIGAPRQTRALSAKQTITRSDREELNISSSQDDKEIKERKGTQENREQDDTTVPIVPLQAQMARRYLSRMKTGKLGWPEQSIGEALVAEGSKKNKLAGETFTERPDKKQQTTSITVDEDVTTQVVEQADDIAHVATSRLEQPATTQAELEASLSIVPVNEDIEDVQTQRLPPIKHPVLDDKPVTIAQTDVVSGVSSPDTTAVQRENEQKIVAPVLALPPEPSNIGLPVEGKESKRTRLKDLLSGSLPPIPNFPIIRTPRPTPVATDNGEKEASFLKRMRHFILGEQQHATSAAALIETPLRVQPNQSYSIRINIMGRNAAKDHATSGLSGMVEGDIAHIEVRSALFQNYAYIVQQADVAIPANGFVAEVMMPMQPLTDGPNGRRERLHIFFMDAMRCPLYEKPFVIELYISHLVQSGREGHNVLSIPV